MIRNVAVLNIAEMFERFAYYGVRSILILFLVYGLGWDKSEASQHYGTFTAAIYFASIVGGLLADFSKKPALIAIIGNSLSTCGAFLLAFASGPSSVYIGLGALAIGSGIFKPAMIGTLWRVSFTHKHRFDFIFTLFYCAINLGAFAAPLVIGGIGDTGNPADFRIGFMVAGAFSLIPTTLLAINYKNLISNDLLYDNQTYRSTDIGITNTVLWFLLSVVFWVSYEVFPVFANASSSGSSQLIMAFISLTCYIVLLPLSLIRNFRSALKIAIGLVLVAIASLFIPLFHLPPGAGLIILAIAETMVVPIMMSQIVMSSSPRFTATIMGAFMFVTLFTNKLAGVMSEASSAERPFVIYLITSLCLGLAVVLMLLDGIQKKREQNLPQQLF